MVAILLLVICGALAAALTEFSQVAGAFAALGIGIAAGEWLLGKRQGHWEKWEETEESLRTQIEKLQREKQEAESSLDTVLSLTSDFFSVFQDGEMKFSSFSGVALRGIWTEFLHEDCREEFEHAIKRALNGETPTLNVRFQDFSQSHWSLWQVFEGFLDRDSSFQAELKRIAWRSRPAVTVFIRSRREEAEMQRFLRTFAQDFRTPLNVIIGLSDLIRGDTTITKQVLWHRQNLLRHCASGLLASVTNALNDCELQWRIPTGLHLLAFSPKYEVHLAVKTAKGKIMRRGNCFDYTLDATFPEVLWGSALQFRHAIGFLIQTCSDLTENDDVVMELRAEFEAGKCVIVGEIQTSAGKTCSQQEFDSGLQWYTSTIETEPTEDCSKLSADKQLLLRLSLARDICRLCSGDLRVVEKRTLALSFTMAFAIRQHFVQRRKGKDREEEEKEPLEQQSLTERLENVMEIEESEEEADESVQRFKSEVEVVDPFDFLSKERKRRTKTLPSCHSLAKSQPPHPSGDRDDCTFAQETMPMESFALVVEDAPSSAMVLLSMLKRLGVRAVVVGTGPEAIGFMDRFLPDVIFMDCQMQGMDGLKAARTIREMRLDVPIVALADSGWKEESECLAAGMNCQLSKPVTLKALASVLSHLKLK